MLKAARSFTDPAGLLPSSFNKIVLVGRLTADPELKTTNEGTSFARFSLAVNRPDRNDAISNQVDYIKIVAWREREDRLAHIQIGNLVLVDCSIIVYGSYIADRS